MYTSEETNNIYVAKHNTDFPKYANMTKTDLKKGAVLLLQMIMLNAQKLTPFYYLEPQMFGNRSNAHRCTLHSSRISYSLIYMF